MGPLGFVNWRKMNDRFRFVMWLVALVLAVVVLTHVMPGSTGRNYTGASQAAIGAQALQHVPPRTAAR
jgi:hypothetical protein